MSIVFCPIPTQVLEAHVHSTLVEYASMSPSCINQLVLHHDGFLDHESNWSQRTPSEVLGWELMNRRREPRMDKPRGFSRSIPLSHSMLMSHGKH